MIKEIKRIMGLIFVAGEEGISNQNLEESLHLSSQEVQEELQALKEIIRDQAWLPFDLAYYNEHWLLVTKPELNEDVERFAQNPLSQKLSRAAIETLAIIAYRQPITRMAIDEIRGVSSQNMIQRLTNRGLILVKGQLEGPGKPNIYGTSDYFLDYFGLESLNDLPEIEALALNAELVSESLFANKSMTISDQESWEED